MHCIDACGLFTVLLLAQAPARIPPDLRFEVAALKPSTGKQDGCGIRPALGGQPYVAGSCPIKFMIQVAFRVKAEQIVGGPGWLDTGRFAWRPMRKSRRAPMNSM
jgi:hypothetical protein